MAIAGKVAITPKGDWNNIETYDKLDLVKYNNSLYIAKKSNQNIIPEDGDIWMLAVKSYDEEEFNKLITDVDDINRNLGEQKMLGWNVPEECPIQNEVNENQFIQKVGRVDLGSFSWTLGYGKGKQWAYEELVGFKNLSKLFCDKYTNVQIDGWDGLNDNEISMHPTSSTILHIRDDSYTDATAFKNANKGVYLYYELATPITIQIDGNEAIENLNASLDYNASKNLAPEYDEIVNASEHYSDKIYVYPSTDYMISFDMERVSGVDIISNNIYPFRTILEYDANDNLINTYINSEYQFLSSVSGTIRESYNYTTGSNTSYLRINFDNYNTDMNLNTRKFNLQVEVGNTQSDYVPYRGRSNNLLSEEVDRIKNDLTVKSIPLSGDYASVVKAYRSGNIVSVDIDGVIRADEGIIASGLPSPVFMVRQNDITNIKIAVNNNGDIHTSARGDSTWCNCHITYITNE